MLATFENVILCLKKRFLKNEKTKVRSVISFISKSCRIDKGRLQKSKTYSIQHPKSNNHSMTWYLRTVDCSELHKTATTLM